ncbi:MAG: hypothetical protein MRJ96_06110 [Nitrospirales bacterium]|nr:hypothetical protein [Nitrospira sp.]MDR4501009.1 hypothetical protein [Nitrospirales bacterium]
MPIGLTVLGILILPIFLYSNAPEGPIKEGDIVFSTGRHRAHFVEPTQYQDSGFQGFCVLEPRTQLLVMQQPATRPDGSFIARPLDRSVHEFPDCPARADLVLHSHQVTLQSDTWSEIKDTLGKIFSFE